MKSFLLIRHAKSSWKFPQLDDHDRPLNKRGQRDILNMADYLNEQSTTIDILFSSSASRALSYANCLSQRCNIPLEIDERYYTFSQAALFAQIQSLDASLDSVAVVAHNPAVTGLVNALTQSSIANVPTSAMVFMQLDILEWAQLAPACADLLRMQTPKALLS